MKKQLLFCFLLFLLGMFSAVAQIPTTQGTEFWASFMRNGYNANGSNDRYTLIASAKNSCRVTVTNPYTNWTTQFSVPENGVNTCVIDRTQGYNEQMGGKANKGLLITSTDTISLYIANEAENSYDAANVLPSSALGTQYMIQSYKAMGDQTSHYGESRASFLVVGTEPETEVQITPSCLTNDNHAAGQPYTITLNRGECYHVLNKNAGTSGNIDGDFSGTTVVSTNGKPIAVFNGNSITSVPGGLSTGYDHIFEQAMPTDYWGKEFVVTSTRCPAYMDLQADQIKVTALNDNTTVRRNGEVLFTLNAGQSNFFQMDLVNNPCTYLEADNPVAVFLYQHSHGSGNPAYGDPSMVWISPVEQTIYKVAFSTFAVQEVQVHYVNIVCYTQNVSMMTLDGQNIASSFSPVPGAPDFSYARQQVNHAAHTLQCPGGFIAHVYGIGEAEGYAYSVGSSAKTLTNQLFVNDDLLFNEYTTCQNENLQFRLETNYEPDLIMWDFGDGAPTETGPEVSHTYNSTGNFELEVRVTHEVNGAQQTDLLNATIQVNSLNEYWVSETTCLPHYTFHGKTLNVPFFGDLSFPGDEGCDTIYHLSIEEGASTSFTLYDTACMEYEWFDTIRYESGTYVVVVNQEGGCDSLYILHLIIGEPPEDPVRNKYSCSPYFWNNQLWCDTTGIYRLSFESPEHCVYDSVLHFFRISADDNIFEVDTCDRYEWLGNVYDDIGYHRYDTTIVGDDGCESHLTLKLTLHPSAPFNRIMGLTQVAVATSFWPGQYIYYLDDSTGMDTSQIQWELLGNPEGPEHWDFRPHGASCTIVAYSMGEKILWVSSGNGDCDKEAFITINCSGYGVDEDETVNLEVYPNPAHDELTVKGHEMQELILYNLLGQKMRVESAEDATEVRLKVDGLPQALYLLEVRTKKGNKTQLVSVIK